MKSPSDWNYSRAPVEPIASIIVVQVARDVFALAYRDLGPDICGIRDRAPPDAVEAWIESAQAQGLAVERHEATDPGPDGARQCVLPGAERVTGAAIAKRRALAPLRARTRQRPCDVGLFSDAADQLDLCEMFQDSTEED
jgi:hypothetical protein